MCIAFISLSVPGALKNGEDAQPGWEAISSVLIYGVITAYRQRPIDVPSLGLVLLGSFMVAVVLYLVFVRLGQRLPPTSRLRD